MFQCSNAKGKRVVGPGRLMVVVCSNFIQLVETCFPVVTIQHQNKPPVGAQSYSIAIRQSLSLAAPRLDVILLEYYTFSIGAASHIAILQLFLNLM